MFPLLCMLGIKGVVLESALEFLNKNNQKTLSWEFQAVKFK